MGVRSTHRRPPLAGLSEQAFGRLVGARDQIQILWPTLIPEVDGEARGQEHAAFEVDLRQQDRSDAPEAQFKVKVATCVATCTARSLWGGSPAAGRLEEGVRPPRGRRR
jgi:hypothetical protein